MVSEVAPLLLLGEDHLAYGDVSVRAAPGGRSAAAITVGGVRDPARAIGKLDPNEDAVLVVDAGRYCLLAVADAHFGRYASHHLLEALAQRDASDLAGLLQPRALLDVLGALADPDGHPDEPSETTLLVAVADRERGEGTGVSFGDSSLVVFDRDAGLRIVTEKTRRYVSPARPGTLAAHGAVRFSFTAGPGQLVAAYTDGVDECHYGRPETSIRPAHLDRLYREIEAPRAETFATRLLELALTGVDGNPGGEDNAAVAVVEV